MFIEEAKNLKPDQRFCTHCKKPLEKSVAWLELDQRTNKYHCLGDVPSDQSQGWFPFGVSCAKKIMKGAKP
jgi:hypothetical protein